MSLKSACINLPENPTMFGKITEAAVYALLTVFFLFVGFASAVSALDTGVAALKAFSILLVFIAALYAMRRFENHTKKLVLPVIALAALLRVGYVFAVPTEPTSDFALLYDVACNTANGDVSWMYVTEGYFSWWQYQIPFVLYEAAIIKLTHSMAALKLMNVIWSVGIVYLVYCISERFLPRYAAIVAAALCAVYPAHIMFCSVLTNQHISLFFILLGALIWIKADSLLKHTVAGALFAVGDMMRPEAAIVVAAILCVCVLAFISRPAKEHFLRLLLGFAVVAVAYLGAKWLAELVLHYVGLAPYGIGNSVPEWKLIVGLNMDNRGILDDKYIYVLNIQDTALRTEEAHRIIREHLSQRGWGEFFCQKLKYFWTVCEDVSFTLAGVNEWDTVFGRVNITNTVYELVFAEQILRALCYLMAAFGSGTLAFNSFKRHDKVRNVMSILTAAILCGTVLAYLLVEIQPRYRFFAMPFVFILAVIPLAIKNKGIIPWKR